MKNLIRKILREQEEEIETIPSFAFFGYDWKDVLDYTDGKKFRMPGNVNLSGKNITTLGGLVQVGGFLDLWNCENLTSLGELRSVGDYLDLAYCQNLTSLGKLRSVGGFLNLWDCENLTSLGKLESVGFFVDLGFCQNLTSLGKLRSVGDFLNLYCTPIANTMSDEEIRAQVNVKGKIYF